MTQKQIRAAINKKKEDQYFVSLHKTPKKRSFFRSRRSGAGFETVASVSFGLLVFAPSKATRRGQKGASES